MIFFHGWLLIFKSEDVLSICWKKILFKCFLEWKFSWFHTAYYIENVLFWKSQKKDLIFVWHTYNTLKISFNWKRKQSFLLFYAHSFFQMSVLFYNMEQWKDITWYEWLYQVSESGNIRSLYDWRIGKFREKTLNPWVNSAWYFTVILSKSWIRKTYQLHRLVAQEHVQNPLNLPCVNHKDWNKLNCHKDNLEWCTWSENNKHAFKTWLHIHYCTWKFWSDNIKSKAVIQYSKSWEFIREWWWQKEVTRSLWLCYSDIWKCCSWKRKTCWWFIWKYKNPTE